MQTAGLLNEKYEYSGKNKKLEIIYIQPNNIKNESFIIDFIWIADWLKKDKNDKFKIEFANVLKIWAND